MKTQTKLMGLVVASLMLPSAFAETTPKKENLRIDFNKMIEDNSGKQNELEKGVTNKVDKQGQSSPLASDKQKVVDLIDVEVNLNKERPLVDRRFNSFGEPHIATEFSPKTAIR